MKIRDLQSIVLAKYQKDDTPAEICCHINGGINLETIKICYQVIHQSGSIHLLGTNAAPRKVKALERIYKKSKIVCAGNRKYQLERFSRKLLQQVSDEY